MRIICGFQQFGPSFFGNTGIHAWGSLLGIVCGDYLEKCPCEHAVMFLNFKTPVSSCPHPKRVQGLGTFGSGI